MKCDDCGKFTTRLHYVWTTAVQPSIDREVCDRCKARHR